MKKIVCIVTLLWAGDAIFLGSMIGNFNYNFIMTKGISGRDFLFKTLGEAKNLISDISYLKADEYYHGGLKHKECKLGDNYSEPQAHGILAGREEKADELKDDHEHDDECEEFEEFLETEYLKRKFSRFNILFRVGRAIPVHTHKHLYGNEERELIPWLYYAVKLNPHNIEAYVVGGYWVGSRLGRVDEALNFLMEGIRYNPNVWQIYSEIGNLYFHQKKDYQQAVKFYSKAASLIEFDQDADKYDKSHIFTFLGASYENIGRFDKALEYYRLDTALFPVHEGIAERIKKLEEKLGKETKN